MFKKYTLIFLLFACLAVFNIFITPSQPAYASIEGEPCSIWWVDTHVEGWPFVTVNWVDSCPMSCFGDLAGDIHTGAVWCDTEMPPPNYPGADLGAMCSASDSRTVNLITAGTLGTSFEMNGNGQIVSGTSFTFTGIPEGIFTLYTQATNASASSGWSLPYTAQHDYSAPTTTANIVGLEGENGWYTSPVSVSFTANDIGCFGVNQTAYTINGGTPTNYAGVPFSIDTEGINTLQYQSTDGHHPEVEKSASIKIDSLQPNLSLVPDSLPNSSGWWNAPVSVAIITDDTTSGIDTIQKDVNGAGLTPYSAPVLFDTDGVHTIDAQVTDKAGNLNYDGVVIQLDSIAPTLVPSVTGTQNGTNWYISAPTLTVSATDATSGVAGLGYTVNGSSLNLYLSPVSFNVDGVYNIQLIALDNAQNSTTQSIQIQFDSTAPSLRVDLVGDKGQNGWFIAPPTFAVTASDTTSDVGSIGYNIENGGWNPYTAPVKITREGLYSISAEVRDNATNSTSHTFQIGYDITPPQTSATLTETEDGIVITLNRWDGVSGYALTRVAINGVWQDYHAPITISEKGEYWVQYFTTDVAGNIEAEKITSFTIAETGVVITQNPPVVNIIPPSNPPNTPPFETADDFPPNLGDETIFYVSPPPPPVIISTPPTFSDDNRTSNNGDGVHTTNTNIGIHGDPPRISRPPVIRENTDTPRLSDVFPLEAHFPPQKNPVRVSPIEYVEHPVAFEPTESTVISDPPADASDGIDVPENAPLDVTMLAMLGLTIAGAGIMKSESAIAKQKEQDAKKANDLAILQAQQDAQKADASANWEENLAMQADAGQDVIVAVKQSQANKNYWAAYAIWLAGVAEANARKVAKAKEQFKLYIETNFKQLALLLGMSVLLGLLSLVSPSQNSSLDPVGKHPKWDEYVQSYTNLLPNMPEKSCLHALPGGGVIVSEECSGGGGGIAFILLWLYWQLTKANVDVRTEPRDNDTILVSHYTSEANATEILATKMISPYEDYVYVFEGRSSSVRAREAGATLYEVRLVFDASPSELEMDPEQTRREIEKRNDILNIYNIMVIHEARRFRFSGSIDISWRRACIERPIHLGIFSLGQWTRCR